MENGLLLETAFVRVNIPRNIFLEMYMPIKSLKWIKQSEKKTKKQQPQTDLAPKQNAT